MPRAASSVSISRLLGLTAAKRGRQKFLSSTQHDGQRFRNVAPRPKEGLVKTLGIIWTVLFNKPPGGTPVGVLPVDAISQAQLMDAPDRSMYRLGHSTLLFKLKGGFWLTDPVFAERASPFRRMGPKRFHDAPLSVDELPALAGVILSHDHYDHLDRETVIALAAKTAIFLTPLGVGQRLIEWGISASKVRELDWWQNVEVDGVSFTATPGQHFSGRSLMDGNSTLWASWVIVDDALRVFFSGDTGYFDGFKTIGDRLGPFDVTFIETGAYDARWPYVHMQPEETVQAHLDLQGKCLVPIHNGTFDLAMHRWQEPFERVVGLAAARGVYLSTPRMGERLDLGAPHRGEQWWRKVAQSAEAQTADAQGNKKTRRAWFACRAKANT